MKKYILIISLIMQQYFLAQSYVVDFDSIAIDNQLDSHFGFNYSIDDILFVDSLENNYNRNREKIDDLYGTLDNCIVFTASKNGSFRNSKSIVGVYRENQIIWFSDYIGPDEEIFGTGLIKVIDDNNNDGEVEIMTVWGTLGGASYSNKSLFVHSWNGNQASLIVELQEGASIISCHEYKIFDFIDIQGDGAFEIIAYSYNDHPTVFEWNGNTYSQSMLELETTEMFFPRNNFTPIVTSNVEQDGITLYYNYIVENSSNSSQSINEFDIYGFDEYTKIYGNINVIDTGVVTLDPNWYGDLLNTQVSWNGYPIKSGERVNGFIYKTKALPVIGETYLRGKNYQWAGDYRDNTLVKDYLMNSVIIKTIAAKLPPSPLIPKEFLDSLLNYNDQSYDLGWIKDEPTYNKYNAYLTNTKAALNQNNNNTARANLQSILTDVDVDSSSTLTSEAYALLKFNTEYLLAQIPETQTNPYLKVNFKDSQGNLLFDGSLKYYASGWKDAINNGDGTFNVETERDKVSLRIQYAGASQDVANIDVQNNTYTFTTVNTKIQLQDSQGTLLDGGIVKYYASGWKDFGTATNGEVTKELLPKEYSFRMSYGGTSIDKKQNISADPNVVFQTVNTKVQLKDSQGNLLDGGAVNYYASGWKDFGTATNGEVTKELLPKEYSFRMSYGGTSVDKKQNIGADPNIVFQTINSKVQLQDSQGNLLNGGAVNYYASGWKEFGTATNGEVAKELLPKEYSFRMSYGGASVDKKQDIGVDPILVFQTVNAKVQLKDSQGNFLNGGQVQYYASGWKDFGTPTNGEATKELLPKEYSFRMSYAGASLDLKQNIGDNSTIIFSTLNCIIRVFDASNQPISNALASYYAAGWKAIGNTVNGEISKELLPKNYSFRVRNNGVNKDKQQDITNNNIVEFVY